jgi:pantoate--beta-alanine ligase
MKIFKNKLELKAFLKKYKTNDFLKIGFVPTMGNLHKGHMQLIEDARSQNDLVVCSIFVNPLQFEAHEDLNTYPRTLDEDIVKLNASKCDILYAPPKIDLYPKNADSQTKVNVSGLSKGFCGKSRPHHFEGVATIIAKLFNLIRPDTAYFGLKDYQQFLLVKQLNLDLELGVEIVGVETFRENTGLALSSRNKYLTELEIKSAPLLFQTLKKLSGEILKGNRNYYEIEKRGFELLGSADFTVDYLAIRNALDLKPLAKDDSEIIILAAAIINKTRLIDNVRFSISEN